MRRLCYLILLLLCHTTSGVIADDNFQTTGLDGEKPAINTTWSPGLSSGANGPVPAIVADQFGYPTKAPKVRSSAIHKPDTIASPISRQEAPMPLSIKPPEDNQTRCSSSLEWGRDR